MIHTLNDFLSLFRLHLPESITFLAIFWFIHVLNHLSLYRLNMFGIIPRFTPSLIFGLWLSPFLHANYTHLIYNSLPLFCLTALLFASGLTKGLGLIIAISILKNIFVWLFARRGIHIGASGLIMGLFSHFLYLGYHKPTTITLLTAILMLYYFGTMIFSVFPSDKKTSFEGHLAGFISGIIVSIYGTPTVFLQIGQNVGHMLIFISRQIL